ncbi:1-acyl-sn-glycerol-3-phosphate acyltransferase, partial [Myxococcota bacterium]|nr:1-acyl-sn-glycerol-3-phosphate acyltransferase [Myxococcota bacterium]
MLDLPLLRRLSLVRRPLSQRIMGQLLALNYGFLPGVAIELEHAERIPAGPVLYAMNHTDRYNYFPFQFRLWQDFDRFTATWVKGKYYESVFLARFMESMLQLPTVSRGYLIAKDFLAAIGRRPTESEYTLLRDAVDARVLDAGAALPAPPQVPAELYRPGRNPFGLAFDPGAGDYADYIGALFAAMMARFVELNREAVAIGLDLLVFPQGTRSRRLLPGHDGIGQMALHLRIPIVPVGCNGADLVYPGASPFARRGRIVYRIGEPIEPGELGAFAVGEDFAPFSAAAERRFGRQFAGVAALVTGRI